MGSPCFAFAERASVPAFEANRQSTSWKRLMTISDVRFANVSNTSAGQEIPKIANTNAWSLALKSYTANCAFLCLMKERKFTAYCLRAIRFAIESSSKAEVDSAVAELHASYQVANLAAGTTFASDRGFDIGRSCRKRKLLKPSARFGGVGRGFQRPYPACCAGEIGRNANPYR